MKCPHCAEDDLKDEALVCKHCGGELTTYRAYDERINGLEKRIAELTLALAESERRPQASHEAPKVRAYPKIGRRRLALAVLLAGVGRIAFLISCESVIERVALLGDLWRIAPVGGIVAVPAVFGLWLGLTEPGAYLAYLGALSGKK